MGCIYIYIFTIKAQEFRHVSNICGSLLGKVHQCDIEVGYK
jgi:hypothetical protein